MQNIDKLHINGLDMIEQKMESITFSQFIEETFNVQFDEIFKDYTIQEVINHEKTSDME